VPHVQAILDIGESAVETECRDRERQHTHVSVRVTHEHTGLTSQPAQTNPQVSVLSHQYSRSLMCEKVVILDGKTREMFLIWIRSRLLRLYIVGSQ